MTSDTLKSDLQQSPRIYSAELRTEAPTPMDAKVGLSGFQGLQRVKLGDCAVAGQ